MQEEEYGEGWKTDDKISDSAFDTAYSDTPFKSTVQKSMKWRWLEGGQAKNKKNINSILYTYPSIA